MRYFQKSNGTSHQLITFSFQLRRLPRPDKDYRLCEPELRLQLLIRRCQYGRLVTPSFTDPILAYFTHGPVHYIPTLTRLACTPMHDVYDDYSLALGD